MSPTGDPSRPAPGAGELPLPRRAGGTQDRPLARPAPDGQAAVLALHCRAGFEPECAAEALRAAPGLAVLEAATASALVLLRAGAGQSPGALAGMLALEGLVFARDLMAATWPALDTPAGGRVEVIVRAARALGQGFGELRLETADTTEARALLALGRALQAPLEAALREAGLLQEARAGLPVLRVLLRASASALVGLSAAGNCSPWPMGIPRLRMPREAPSRSTLKLEEALQVFLSQAGRERALAPGMRAVDLGAAPGGWTWQLTRRGLRVVAVDNGALDRRLLDSPLVEHRREDGFRYAPRAPVDWMVCDMVAQPRRVAQLVARWLSAGWCQRTVFNLKLPMKRRLEELDLCRAILAPALGARGRLRFRQLYHDREEVTGYAELPGGRPARSSPPPPAARPGARRGTARPGSRRPRT